MATPKKAPAAKQSSLISPVERAFKRYYPQLLPALKVSLAVCAGLVFKDKTKPISLILENPSGRGKSTVIETFFPQLPPKSGTQSKMHKYVYRTDSFTPKAFVTNAANMTEAQRQKVDLLPKLENKLLLTKELAPIFRGQENDLLEMFKVLIPVLDGKGHMTDTGLASRGYARPIVFNWLGATTPLPRKAFKMMSQLGTRLLFYETPIVDFSERDLIAYALRNDSAVAADSCNREVNHFVIKFFGQRAPRSVGSDSVTIDDATLRQIVNLALFLVQTRAEVSYERRDRSWEPVAVHPSEGPHKVINYFMEIARAHAMISARGEVNEDDLSQIRHIAISSTPNHLRPMIWELATKGEVDTSTGAKLCHVSDTTISERYSKELELLGVVGALSTQAGKKTVYKLNSSLDWITKIKPPH